MNYKLVTDGLVLVCPITFTLYFSLVADALIHINFHSLHYFTHSPLYNSDCVLPKCTRAMPSQGIVPTTSELQVLVSDQYVNL